MKSRIVGPLWEAEVEVFELANPVKNLALRALFVENGGSPGHIQRLSTTLLMLAEVRKVEVQELTKAGGTHSWTRPSSGAGPKAESYAEIRDLVRSGAVVLLLVESDDQAKDGDGKRRYTCLAGEINLDRMQPQGDAQERLFDALGLRAADPGERSGPAGLSGRISAHASGLSIFGQATLPWQVEPVAASFQLTARLPGPAIRLTVERERLTDGEQRDLNQAWRNLGASINPGNPQYGPAEAALPAPHWVTLEIANLGDVPHLYWEWDPTADTRAVLHLRGDQLELLLSDQQLYDQGNPPTSLARVALNDILVERQGEELHIEIMADSDRGSPGAATERGTLRYIYMQKDEAPTESLELSTVGVAYDPIETPRLLRKNLDLPEPEWLGATSDKPAVPIKPAVLWGFMPLEDGWAQLPVPNLTEQIYLDAELEQLEQAPAQAQAALLQGAVAFGNAAPKILAAHPEEQPWNLTLVDAQKVAGRWVLAPDQSKTFRLTSVSLEIGAPEVVLNGLLWLSTAKPTCAEALPNLDDWTAGLQSIPLQTVDPSRDLFPPLLTMTLGGQNQVGPVRISLRPEADGGASALLGAWSLAYQVDQAEFQRMREKKVLPPDAFSGRLPWVWRRHPNLPMIQALPLTQNQSPPNYPSPSRQMVPFELVPAEPDPDSDWVLGVFGETDAGAATWPRLLSQATPAGNWVSLDDLPLVALSLPGIVLDPKSEGSGLGVDAGSGLPVQYRFDLPYTDEINALAQLPKVRTEGERASAQPEALPPLTPETFKQHWAQLSELASLASAEAVEAFHEEDSQASIRHLVEPFEWTVEPDLDLDTYPGKLALTDGGGSQILSAESALRGISGDFAADHASGRIVTASSEEEHPFRIEAGSMAAHRDQDGVYRDQRGLSRQASLLADGGQLIKTPVRLHQKDETQGVVYELTSALAPIELAIGDPSSHRWQFWFRDLPVQQENRTFDRQQRRSNRAEDINDPEALSRERDYLSGHEWRLGGAAESKAVGRRSPEGEITAQSLFGLDFYPLTLEKVSLGVTGVQRVEMVGRLQLPLEDQRELEDLGNAVRLTFVREGSEEQLHLQGIDLESDVGEWPLALERGEDGGAPRLLWDQIELSQGQIQVGGVGLRFFLFGVEWTLALDSLTFPQTGSLPEFQFTQSTSARFYPKALDLSIDPTASEYDLKLTLGVELGKQDGKDPVSRFKAEVQYDLLGIGEGSAALNSGFLFGDLELQPAEDSLVWLTENALQFGFGIQHRDDLQLLPGMQLQAGKRAPGFVALTFTARAKPDGAPDLQLTSAFVEAILFSRWNAALQDQRSGQLMNTRVFNSSAGDLVFGYTTQLQAGAWDESLLLNGFLEVKNLISWPTELIQPSTDPVEPTKLILPNVPQDGKLNHTRHSIRVLFNQHQVPIDNLVTSPSENLLFNLLVDKPWQFLAVVEHQLVEIAPAEGWEAFSISKDRRWTTLQEVRLVAPQHFSKFLKEHADARLTAPIPGNGDLRSALDYGYLGENMPAWLINALDTLPKSTLMVEASAPHWINARPIQGTQMTTLQFLPNGSQHGILSGPQDYAPSDPEDPKWLLLPMPFLGRLQGSGEDFPPESGEVNALQVDPILFIHKKAAAAPSLVWALSHWRKDESTPAEVMVSAFDTVLGHTWARLDPTSLEENWFRLQTSLPEAEPATTQSVMAARPNTPARLSRATALQRAFDAFRPVYPPDMPADLDWPPVEVGDDMVWRRDSLMVLQGVRAVERLSVQGGNLITNGAFNPGTSPNHPLHPALPAVNRDRVPHGWEVFEFAFNDRHYRGQSSTGWTSARISNQVTETPTRRDWGLPRLRPPNQDELKPPARSGTSLLIYADLPRNKKNPVWIKIGQSVQLEPGRYRFSISVFPAQEGETKKSSLQPEASQVVLFAGKHKTAILDGTDLPFGHWSTAALEFEISKAESLRVGVELHGPDNFERNGWHLNNAELYRMSDAPDGWHVTAAQLRGLQMTGEGETAEEGLWRHPAVTLMPAQLTIDNQDNPRPLSFAVSPYQGMEFRPVSAALSLQLVSVELLCLERASGTLRPAASRFWELQGKVMDMNQVGVWARETQRRLCPDSPIAVLRLREISKGEGEANGSAAVLIPTYRFAIVPDLDLPSNLARREFRLRTAVDQLRFREGQFGGSEIPEEIVPFEITPPQTTGVQPLYLTERPEADSPVAWPWGLSALRLSVQYTPDKQAAIGQLESAPPNNALGQSDAKSLTLWWQAAQHFVQYRSGVTSARPAWGLPKQFRARAIKSLLTVLPNPPLPALDFSEQGLQAWQPVLPGALRYLISGARAGAMFAIRNQLLRQSSLAWGEKGETGRCLVSGSVPVQHRMPRPVPLPRNQDRGKALQPWSSFFEPERNLLASLSPADEAFFAPCAGHPARRLRMRLKEPARGAVTSAWNGELDFEIQVDSEGDTEAIEVLKWVAVEVTDGEQTFACQIEEIAAQPGAYRCKLEEEDFRRLVESKLAGQILIANAFVGHDPDTDGFRQKLTFALRMVDEGRLPLPLAPHFIHFEDPEYNRRLSSPAAAASGTLRENEDLHTVTLATDRREYNPDSHLALRYDWDDDKTTGRRAALTFKRIGADGIARKLDVEGPADEQLSNLPPGKLMQLSLLNLRLSGELVRWQPGDSLQLILSLQSDDIRNAPEIYLAVNIVETPVIPAPEAAYALLRWQHEGTQVECVRFAWQPNASRIELICPDDLRTEVVRRRAVFQWRDSARPKTVNGYAVQKIAMNGSTHFPGPVED
jgi:hypothetical protein